MLILGNVLIFGNVLISGVLIMSGGIILFILLTICEIFNLELSMVLENIGFLTIIANLYR